MDCKTLYVYLILNRVSICHLPALTKQLEALPSGVPLKIILLYPIKPFQTFSCSPVLYDSEQQQVKAACTHLKQWAEALHLPEAEQIVIVGSMKQFWRTQHAHKPYILLKKPSKSLFKLLLKGWRSLPTWISKTSPLKVAHH